MDAPTVTDTTTTTTTAVVVAEGGGGNVGAARRATWHKSNPPSASSSYRRPSASSATSSPQKQQQATTHSTSSSRSTYARLTRPPTQQRTAAQQAQERGRLLASLNLSQTCVAFDVNHDGSLAIFGGKGLSLLNINEAMASASGLDAEASLSKITVERNPRWEVNLVKWAPFHNTLATVSNTVIRIWKWQDSKLTQYSKIDNAHNRAVKDISWSPFERNLLCTRSGPSTYLWDLRFANAANKINSLKHTMGGLVEWNRCNAMYLLSTSLGQVHVWDIRKTATPVLYITAHAHDITDVDWHHKYETSLITASQDKTVKEWDTTQPKHHQHIVQTGVPVVCAQYSPSLGGVLTLGRGEHAFKQWSFQEPSTPIVTYAFHTDTVQSFVWKKTEGEVEEDSQQPRSARGFFAMLKGSRAHVTNTGRIFSWGKDRRLNVWDLVMNEEEYVKLREDSLTSSTNVSIVPTTNTNTTRTSTKRTEERDSSIKREEATKEKEEKDSGEKSSAYYEVLKHLQEVTDTIKHEAQELQSSSERRKRSISAGPTETRAFDTPSDSPDRDTKLEIQKDDDEATEEQEPEELGSSSTKQSTNQSHYLGGRVELGAQRNSLRPPSSRRLRSNTLSPRTPPVMSSLSEIAATEDDSNNKSLFWDRGLDTAERSYSQPKSIYRDTPQESPPSFEPSPLFPSPAALLAAREKYSALVPLDLNQEFLMISSHMTIPRLKIDEVNVVERYCIATYRSKQKQRLLNNNSSSSSTYAIIIQIKITFPSFYPHAPPSFQFLPDTNVDYQRKILLQKALNKVARFHMQHSRPCLEQCLVKLVRIEQELEIDQRMKEKAELKEQQQQKEEHQQKEEQKEKEEKEEEREEEICSKKEKKEVPAEQQKWTTKSDSFALQRRGRRKSLDSLSSKESASPSPSSAGDLFSDLQEMLASTEEYERAALQKKKEQQQPVRSPSYDGLLRSAPTPFIQDASVAVQPSMPPPKAKESLFSRMVSRLRPAVADDDLKTTDHHLQVQHSPYSSSPHEELHHHPKPTHPVSKMEVDQRERDESFDEDSEELLARMVDASSLISIQDFTKVIV
ncbi:SEA (Seh1-associated) complex subunit, variant 2 [Balamuthia mandrillaris]